MSKKIEREKSRSCSTVQKKIMENNEMVEKLMQFYKDNPDDFTNDIEELDSWNGCLGDERCTPMDELDEIYQGTEPTEILRRAFFGRDDDGWHYEDGEKVHESFNPNRDYFYYNGYGNLVSTDEKDYSDFLDENFVEDIIENSAHLCLSDGAKEIIDSQDDDEDDEDE